MKNLGETLKGAREGKGWTLEYAARETNIVRRYLAALEDEDFSQFSSSAYAMGFLRNYGEFLGLDTDELVSLYRSMQIQETSAPLDDLLKKPPLLPKIIPVAVIIAAVLGVGAGVYFFLTAKNTEVAPVAETRREKREYQLADDGLNERFYVGDTVVVTVHGETYELSVDGIDDTVNINAPEGMLRLNLNQESAVDFNRDGTEDLRIVTGDFEANKPEMGVQLRFESAAPQGTTQTAGEIAEANAGTAEISLSSAAARQTGPQSVAIFNAANPYPFTLNAAFRGPCMFRWEILREANRKGRTENYFSANQEVSIQAQNGVRLWVSNAAAVRLQTIGAGQTVNVNLGAAGEVVVADITWTRDESGRSKLVLQRLDG